MESRPQIFACVGPESTGKTTLCNQLASHFKGSVIPEFAREYLNARNGVYEKSDLLTIAQGQLELENRIISTSSSPIFCDTDILVILVWYQFKYRKRNKEIEALFDQQLNRKYLLTYPDLEWEPDPLRENPNELEELFNLYESTLTSIGTEYRIVSGLNEQRLQNAIEAINQMKLG